MLILWTYDDSSKYLNVYYIGEFYEYVIRVIRTSSKFDQYYI